MSAKSSAPSSKPEPPEPPHYCDHRERLRERFYSAGADALSDYELLEMALFPALPRRDTKLLAKTLIKTFGSFAEIVHAAVARLRKVEGVGETAIDQLKLIAAAASRVTRCEVKSRNALSSCNEVIDYCRSSMAFADKEQFRLSLPRQAQLAHRRRCAADRHRPPRRGLSARGDQACPGIIGDCADPGA